MSISHFAGKKGLRIVLAAVGFACCAAGYITLAQTPSAAWFGLPAPGAATDQVVDFTHLDMPRIPAPDASRVPDLEGAKLVQYIKDVVGFSYASRAAGDKLWGRLAGNQYTDQTVAYVAKQWREAGLTVTEQAVPFMRSNHPLDWHARLLGAPEFGSGSGPIDLASATPMPVTAGGGGGRGRGAAPAPEDDATAGTDASGLRTVTAPLVFAGDGSATTLAMTDVKGKIALVVIEPVPSAFYSDTTRQVQGLIRAGAVGVIATYDMPGNMQLFLGGCPPQTICFTVGGEDGSFLRAAIEHAAAAKVLDKLQMELSVTRAKLENLQAHVLIGKIEGRNHSENIVLTTHSDSWFSGADDNASGIAGLIGLAKQYARGPKPQHDLYFFLSPGHHSATGGTPASLVKYDPSLPKNNIVMLNLEHIGQAGTYRSYTKSITDKYGRRSAAYLSTNWDSQGREVTMGPNSAAIRKAWVDASVRDQYTAPATIFVSPVAEIAPFVAAGGAGIQDVETSPWFHTSGDTVETISPEAMQRVAMFYKDFIDSMDELSRAKVREGLE